MLLHDIAGPDITLVPEKPERIGPAQPLELSLYDDSGLRSVQVVVRRGGKDMTVLRRDFPQDTKEARLSFDLSETRRRV